MEICEAPDPVEVTNFHFCQLRTLRLAKGDEKVPKDCINIVASASKYGLLFVGIEHGFKVFKLENILNLSEDRENKSIEENYYCQVVSSETPVLMSISADQKTLAVCFNRNGSLISDMYDIAAFEDPQSTPVPFQNVLLSGNGTKLKDFAWNPVAVNTYAFCTSDGSLSVHELTGTDLKIAANIQNASALSVCWSPKGKQIVVGKIDGSFSQYKPTLQEVKNIPPPTLDEKVTVENICWVSTTQFVVLYVPITKGSPPYLFVVSTPKGSPIVYQNFYDVCLGNSSSDEQRYFLHFEPTWGVTVCASRDSIEIAIIGDCPNWVQWDVKEDGKALLPGKDGASHAIGMGVMYCAQRKIVISEYESYQPMPIIFFLTNNGLLVSYHMINNTPGLESLVYPTEPFDKASERKRHGGLQNLNQGGTPQPSLTAPSSIMFQPPSAFQPQPVQESKSALAATSPFNLKQGFSQNKNEQVSSGIKLIPTSNNSASPAQPASMPVAKVPIFSVPDQASFRTPPSNTTFDVTPTSDGLSKSSLRETLNSTVLASKETSNKQNTYIGAIVDEVQTFEKELHDLKLSLSSFAPIGTKDEMIDLKSATLNAQDFQKEMLETMTSLNTDIHDLKNALLESFVMVEDANTRERRKNDHLYLSLLRERALDPVTAKRLKQIEQHYMYLSTQLQEVSNKIDQDWFEYLEKKKSHQKSTSHLSSAEAIYKTLVNNQNIIHNLKKNIDLVFDKATEKRLENISRRKNRSPFTKRTTQEELSKLADTFLQTKISNDDDKAPKFKKISPEAQKVLKSYFSSAKVNTVRPTVVCSPSQSRLISKSALYSENMKKKNMQADNKVCGEKATPVIPFVAPLISKEKLNSLNNTFATDKMQMLHPKGIAQTLPSIQSLSPQRSPSVSSSGEPYYEDITPPGSPGSPDPNTLALIQELMSRHNIDEENLQMLLNIAVRYKSDNLKVVSPSNSNAGEFTDPENNSLEEQYSGSKFSQSNVSVQSPSVISALNVSYGGNKSFISTVGAPKSSPILQKNNFPSFKANENQPSSSFSFSQPMSVKTSDNLVTSNQLTVNQPQVTSNTVSTASNFSPWTRNELRQNIVSTDVPPNQTITTSTPFIPAPNKTVLFSPQSNNNVLNLAGSKKLESKSSDTENKSLLKDGNSLISSTLSNVPVSATDGIGFSKSNLTLAKSQGGNFFGGNIQNSFSAPQASSNTTSTTLSSPVFGIVNAAPSEHKTSESPFSFSLKSPDTSSSSFTFGKSLFGSKISTVSTPPSLTFTQVATSDSVVPNAPSEKQAKSIDSKSAFSAAGDSLFGQVLASESSSKKDSSSFQFVPTPTSEPESKIIELSLSDIGKNTTVVSSPAEANQLIVASTASAAVTSANQLTSAASENSTSKVRSATTSNIPGLQSSENKDTANINVPTTPPDVASAITSVSSPVSSESSASAPTTNTPSLFAQNTNGTSLFAAPATTQSLFGGANGSQTSFFSKPALETTAAKTSLFGTAPVDASTPSFFGKTSEAPAFGQNTFTQGSAFGSTPTTTQGSVFGSAATSFFSQAPGGAGSVFGTKTTNTSENTGFGNQTGGSFTFGKSPFGQTQGTFGLAKSVFGQNSSFNQPAASQPNNFGQSTAGSIFGQGSFSFSGLGGKPSEENASKNIFAMGNLGKPASDSSNVFGSPGASAFGAKTNAFSPGSFSSGGGSVAQSGFGAFQQNSQKPSGFGSSAAFGSSPSFGSSPAFGSPPSFGSGNALASVFGSSQQQSPSFSGFASADSPTFGALASQTPSFGSPQQQQQQQQGFGSAPVFGGGSSFGGQAPSFGSPSGGQSNSSAFTQWRN
ncbi:nuclear pore complex protein Nup214 isoform X2 [Parasteatoda tepidariorum]|uniref:nuclear pore complex protein Nup214 isoform X2 n=1 Tax=Parasteatoda tepidariorum TaxID=114398 RepID=UPI001C71A03C|nr:nuclear pore complex protein Nup214 isoform X2 [Parasteatoda tepidariorum]